MAIGGASSGAVNDLAGATQMASRMVTEFGLSPDLGPVCYDETQRLVDRSTELLRTHRGKLDRLAALLREKETIDGAAVGRTPPRNPMP